MAKKVKNFEENLARLQEIQASLEQGDVPIEVMLEAYEEGMKLVADMQSYLENAQQKVTDITKKYAQDDEDV
ncbi:MAG: exodeoxyribonuclease VII small subunit [Candidatus Kapaibacterium sp.]